MLEDRETFPTSFEPIYVARAQCNGRTITRYVSLCAKTKRSECANHSVNSGMKRKTVLDRVLSPYVSTFSVQSPTVTEKRRRARFDPEGRVEVA